MIDLHLHLDGSLSPQDVISLARLQNTALPADSETELLPYLTAPPDCADLNEYLRCFALPLSLLQTKEALGYAAGSLVKRLAQSGIIYAELRFAPQLHTERGLNQRAAVTAVLEGIRSAASECPRITVGLILCCMRIKDNSRQNTETAEVAAELLGDGVCALDLAGAEALYPTSEFSEVFRLAASAGVPFTIHAGEAAGPDSVRAALDMGAARIGHGVRTVYDDGLTRELIRRRIPLEMCPTSNLQTRAVPDLASHPLLRLLDKGAAVTVNTDNMTVSGTTIDGELALLRERSGMTRSQERQLLLNAADAAFAPETERARLRNEVERRYSGVCGG